MAVAGLLACCALATAGCGASSEGSSTVETDRPEAAFAPVVALADGERYRPASVPWFIERSVLWFAEDEGCPDRKIAVGHTLPEQHTVDTDWIIHPVLGGHGGGGWAYFRNPNDAHCVYKPHFRAYADQHIRPHDRADRPARVGIGEGFFLDLVDADRAGPAELDRARAYFERVDEGRSTVRLSYWLLFGMNAPAQRPDETHEGDWERLDVILRRDGDSGYVPRAVAVGAIDSQGAPAPARAVRWRRVEVEDGTHPVVIAGRGDHALRPARRGAACPGCERWRTRRALEAVRKQPWYGFGGAWGELGPTGATTGPLGPHGRWRPDDS